MTAFDVFVLLAIGWTLRSAADFVIEYRANRPRLAVYPDTYRDPCGPSCSIKPESEKGWQRRTSERVDRIAERLHKRLTRGATR